MDRKDVERGSPGFLPWCAWCWAALEASSVKHGARSSQQVLATAGGANSALLHLRELVGNAVLCQGRGGWSTGLGLGRAGFPSPPGGPWTRQALLSSLPGEDQAGGGWASQEENPVQVLTPCRELLGRKGGGGSNPVCLVVVVFFGGVGGEQPASQAAVGVSKGLVYLAAVLPRATSWKATLEGGEAGWGTGPPPLPSPGGSLLLFWAVFCVPGRGAGGGGLLVAAAKGEVPLWVFVSRPSLKGGGRGIIFPGPTAVVPGTQERGAGRAERFPPVLVLRSARRFSLSGQPGRQLAEPPPPARAAPGGARGLPARQSSRGPEWRWPRRAPGLPRPRPGRDPAGRLPGTKRSPSLADSRARAGGGGGERASAPRPRPPSLPPAVQPSPPLSFGHPSACMAARGGRSRAANEQSLKAVLR